MPKRNRSIQENLWVAAVIQPQATMHTGSGIDWRPLQRRTAPSRASVYGCVPPEKMAAVEDTEAPTMIIGDCRLDNRSDLCQRLRIPSTISDLQIILHAYRRWGDDCAVKLVGAFAFAIWDVNAQRLFCVRDHMGLRTLYYYADANAFVFANEPSGVLQHPSVPHRPNLRQIAGMAMPSAHLQDPGATFFEHVRALPCASTLTLVDVVQRITTYWRPDPQARLNLPVSEIPDALRHLLHDAVAARLPRDEPAMALLSGGLDSSSTVAVAANVLKERNQRLTTLSAVLPAHGQNDIVDESPYIDQFRAWDNIDMISISAQGRGPFDDVRQLVETNDRAWFTSRHYLYAAFAKAAKDNQSVHIMDGVGGELGPTFHGDGIYAEQLIRARWRYLARELKLRAERDKTSLRSVIKSRVVRPLIPSRIAALIGYHPPGANVARVQENQIFQPAFLASEFGNEKSTIEAQLDGMFATRPDHRLNQVRAISLAQQFFETGGFVGADSLTMTYPFLDKRILEFCLAVPAELKIRDGYNRFLIRTALDGLLPPKIQWRTSKEPFSPDYHLRYNRQRPWAQRFLAEIESSDTVCRIVDVERLNLLAKHEMQGNRGSTSADMAALHFVPMGIYLIVFLRQFSEFR